MSLSSLKIKQNYSYLKIISLIICFFGSIQTYAQNEQFTIEGNNIPIKQVFEQIEAQSKYTIAYSNAQIDVKQKITIHVQNNSLKEVLEQTLKDTEFTYKINGLHLIIIPLLAKSSSTDTPRQTLRGVIKDAALGTAIPYANVVLSNTTPQIGTTSDSLGYFSFNRIPVGRYNIQVSYLGYEPASVKEILLTSAKEVYCEITLAENSHKLNEVIVHAKINKERPLNPMALTGGRVLTVEESSRFAGGFDDPARLVSSFAGVSGGINTNALVIRGNSPQFSQWRMEDVEVSNPTHYADMTGLGGGLLTGLSANVLGNSDFFSSTFPAEYTNALAGVFDMSMRTGNDQNNEHAFQFGVWGIDFASEGPINKKQHSSYIVNYRYSFSGLSDAISGADEGLDYQDLAFKLNFPTKKTGIFTIWGIGLMDKVLQKNKEEPEEWEYISDRQKSDNTFTKGMFGIGHKIDFRKNAYIKTSLAATYSKVHATIEQVDKQMIFHNMADVQNSNTDLILKSYLHSKINKRHFNRTGFGITRMSYNLDFNISNKMGLYEPMQQIAKGNHADFAFSAFTNSVFSLEKNIDASIGITGQFFSLNNHWTLEPRLSVIWKLPKRQTLSFAYGLHSIRSRLDYYYVKTPETGDALVNKELDFSKAHHFSLSYGNQITDNLYFKIEPYFQSLYHIPVELNTSFSILNYNAYGLDKKLVNKGKGRNYGVEITLERYLDNGWYGMFTGSLFKSKYMGGDKVWRNTRMNQGFITNGLIGKEWVFGKRKHKVFSANLRLTYQGGYRYTPIDKEESQNEQSIKEDETRAYSLKLPNSVTADLTLRLRVNKKKSAHEFSFMILNANGFKQTTYVYNMITNTVEKKRYAPIVPNISWKIYF